MTNCFLNYRRPCDPSCEAYAKLEAIGNTVDGLELFWDKENNAGMVTYCKLIASLWGIGENLRRERQAQETHASRTEEDQQ